MGMILVPPRKKKLKPVEKRFAVDLRTASTKATQFLRNGLRVDDDLCGIGAPAGQRIGQKAPHHHS